jgi:hypothetical protein
VKAYAIKDWRTRFLPPGYKVKKGPLVFVGIPTKHDSCGYRRLVAESNGAALYGAWVVLVAVAGKCPVKGVLATDRPLTPSDLAVRTGLPETVFTELLERASRDDIGWVEEVDWPILTREEAGDALESPENPSESQVLPENAGNRRKTPTTDNTDKTEPTRQNLQDKTDTTKSDRGLLEDFIGSGRNSNERGNSVTRFRNLFAMRVGMALGPGCGGTTRQRKPLIAVAKRFENRPDRDDCLAQCETIAKEKAGASLQNHAAAWQAEVNRLYPGG